MSAFDDLMALANSSPRNQQQPPSGTALPSYMYNLNFPPVGDGSGAGQSPASSMPQPPAATPAPVAPPPQALPQAGIVTKLNGIFNPMAGGGGGGGGAAAGAASSGGGCCFIFIEANGGTLDPLVRGYRDDLMTPRNRRGYYRLADKLVPWMRKNKLARKAVEWCMVNPMMKAGRWYKERGRFPAFSLLTGFFWLTVYDLMGIGAYQRKTGELI